MAKPRAIAAVAVAVAALFVIVNRAAYEGFFLGDDLQNIVWTWRASGWLFLAGLFSPIFDANNFRPVGHFVYWAMGAGFPFARFVALIQALHLLVAGLVYLLAKRLGVSVRSSAVGALFFVFHMALFDVFWKPMFLFDLLCGVWCALAILAWLRESERRRWWAASFACFWLAYQSKEVAVMLPAVLLLYEWTIGEKRWKPLLPFFGVSLLFGLQAVMSKHTGPYALSFHLQGLMATANFYAQRVFEVRWLTWLPVALLGAAWRSRLAWFGFGSGLLLLFPMLALPGRMSAAYLYVPLIALSLLVTAAAERVKAPVALVALAGWLAWNFVEMRRLRNVYLADATAVHHYFDQLRGHGAEVRVARLFVADGFPRELHAWGAEALIQHFSGKPDTPVAIGGAIPAEGPLAIVSWQPTEQRLFVFDGMPQEALNMKTGSALSFGAKGWHEPEGLFRWTDPEASLRLRVPSKADALHWRILVPPEQAQRGAIRVVLSTEEHRFPALELDHAGWYEGSMAIDAPLPREVVVHVHTEPAFHADGDGRALGVAVGELGFR
jgi:hypothetical protein